MQNKLVIDTSVFIERLDIVEKISKEYTIIFPITVADELNKLKDSKSRDTSYHARKALHYINDKSETWYCDYEESEQDNDLSIIQVAVRNEASLLTFDLGMELRAKLYDVDILKFEDSEYGDKGYKIIELSSDNENDMLLLSQFYQNRNHNIFDCYTNEYLVIKQDGNIVEKTKWDGEEYKELLYSHDLKARTFEQSLAIDLILDKDIPIKAIHGLAGSGKTYLASKLAMEMIGSERYSYDKILLLRNPVGSGESIGYLKGDKDDKIESFFNSFRQHFIGTKYTYDELIKSGRIVIEVPYYIKGLDIKNTLVLFDEAEDCDNKLMRLIGTRVGEGSSIIILGDGHQAESKYNNMDNGLKTLITKARGNENFGHVSLSEDLRSGASKLFVDIF